MRRKVRNRSLPSSFRESTVQPISWFRSCGLQDWDRMVLLIKQIYNQFVADPGNSLSTSSPCPKQQSAKGVGEWVKADPRPVWLCLYDKMSNQSSQLFHCGRGFFWEHLAQEVIPFLRNAESLLNCLWPAESRGPEPGPRWWEQIPPETLASPCPGLCAGSSTAHMHLTDNTRGLKEGMES